MGLHIDRTTVPGRKAFTATMDGEVVLYELQSISIYGGEAHIEVLETNRNGEQRMLTCAENCCIEILGGTARLIYASERRVKFLFDIADECRILRSNAKDDRTYKATA